MVHPLRSDDQMPGAGETRRILVVNDDPFQLDLTARTIREMGHEVVVASDGEEAILRAVEGPDLDLVVTDLYMPRIDGWKLCRLLRSSHFPRFNRVPILVQSATFAGSDTEQVTRDNGANHFLPVPYPPDELRRSVDKLLAGEIPQKPVRALVVNANDALRRMVADAMRRSGYEVAEAAGAERARVLRESHRPELVVLGHPLPDGIVEELVAELKAAEERSTVIVVAESPAESLAVRVTRHGADAFVREPFEIDYLIALCEKTRRERSLIRIEELLADRSRELSQSERKYRDLIENAIDIIFMLDVEGVVIEVNDAFLRASGYSPRELIGSHFTLLLHPADLGRARAAASRAARGGDSQIEMRLKDKVGGFGWYSFAYRPITDPDGSVLAIHAVGRDITEQKDAAARLEWMGRVIAQVGEGIAVADLEGTIVFANPAFARIHGSDDAAALAGKGVREFLDEGAAPDLIPFRDEVLRAGRHTGELTHLRADGVAIHARTTVSVFTGADGRRAGYVLLVQDLSERRAAAQALTESEERFALVAGRTSDIIVTRALGAHPSTQFLCGRCEQILGYSAEEMTNGIERWLERIPLEDRHVFTQPGGRPFDGPPGDVEWTYRFQTREGRTVHLREQGVRQAEDGVTKVHSAIRDVTAQVTAEQERENLQRQLLHASKMESIGTLAGGIAHDFNNLLTGVMGNQELASLYVGDAGREYLNNAKAAAARAADLVKKLLAFSRKEKLERKVLDLGTIVHETRKVLSETFDRRIHIDAQVPEDLRRVNADAGQVQQVLMNLCINARDALTDVLDGRVATALRERYTISISLSNWDIDDAQVASRPEAKPGAYVLLRVADNGAGMSEETKQRLFEPFFTTKEAGRGTGLGLATVFGIVKQHEGWIDFDSRLGSGTEFRIYLPAAAESRSVEATPGIAVDLPRGTETILVVDDEAVIRDILRETLQQAGYTVIVAEDGRKGVEAFIEHRARIGGVILDLTMPRMSGGEALDIIRSKSPNAKVVISTGHADLIDRDDYLRRGASAFVPKPYKLMELLRTLRTVLDR
ncbi:MAG: response regulator [Deltaproteobacteria bacterium]|nr:response regulator [Deltaproteobacteria bacterium]